MRVPVKALVTKYHLSDFHDPIESITDGDGEPRLRSTHGKCSKAKVKRSLFESFFEQVK